MELDQFSLAKQFVHVGDARVAYTDEGDGSPVFLLDAVGLHSVHVVGHDHGGAVAQLLACEHPRPHRSARALQRRGRDAVDGLRRFDHPTMLLWGTEDVHFRARMGRPVGR